MRILISGGTGLIGTGLIREFMDQGDEVVCLTRNPARMVGTSTIKYIPWSELDQPDATRKLGVFDVIINLAGESIGTGRWTRAKKLLIENSRIEAGELLSKFALNQDPKPQVFVQSSAIGYYGTDPNKQSDETSPAGDDYLANLAVRWEKSSAAVEQAGIRRVVIRTGVVLDRSQGALPRMVLPFLLYSGGALGDGRQWISWIHLQDAVRAITFLIKEQKSGVFNLISPNPVQNAAFGRAIASTIHRPYWFTVPKWVLQMVLGEMSTLVLDGQRVAPRRLQQEGYSFNYPLLEDALKNILLPGNKLGSN